MRRLATALTAVAVTLTVLGAGMARAKPPSAFPVDVSVARPPQPVMAEGRAHLVYELRLTNLSRNAPIEITRLEVLGEPGDAPLAVFDAAALPEIMAPVGLAEDDKAPRLVGMGRGVTLFLDVALAPGARAPRELHHRLSVSARTKTRSFEDVIDGLDSPVISEPAPTLAPPLRGAGWMAANGLAGPDHRRALMPVDGRARIAQRYAIDWVQIGPNGKLFRTDGKANADFFGYGADLLAVADGRVVGVRDGQPDNTGVNTERAVPITLETLAGNYVLLDIGHGRYALYAHVQPGSFRVKVGDRVRTGQVLARLGNSGNSDAPHLHFHLVDAPSAMGAEGIPYAFDFTQAGVAPDPDALVAGAAWTAKPGAAPVAYKGELPSDRAVVSFR